MGLDEMSAGPENELCLVPTQVGKVTEQHQSRDANQSDSQFSITAVPFVRKGGNVKFSSL